ncbi:MAG: hypothetical protein UX62_C0021G0006 [Microgenomates group bacterium GW2011_GWA2_46_7]|uniref:Uncharacterized protein n=1 Tax=Candidatus Daviesbacteria bacterium GW2011_GWB1_41_5 TaxID=1618429 RepID=A0A0G0YXE1_9BACT|nr:MAG: hypothetical protein UU67_C0002G0027 [Candidatus Daviesbacteria bacterium GW2011_GWB1_41_5]KKU46024.1 MAG: hypothetical protein UX62_C0021G0006 [Microgenomates group bacterium GW2011_GWA2_46_7]
MIECGVKTNENSLYPVVVHPRDNGEGEVIIPGSNQV